MSGLWCHAHMPMTGALCTLDFLHTGPHSWALQDPRYYGLPLIFDAPVVSRRYCGFLTSDLGCFPADLRCRRYLVPATAHRLSV